MLLMILRARCDLLKIVVNSIKRLVVNNNYEINAEIVIIVDINLLITIENVVKFFIISIF